MARNQKQKSKRMRGKTTHGWGSMKKHRGAGNRGGRGNAGSHKQKAASYNLKGHDKGGFKNLSSSHKQNISINVYELCVMARKESTADFNLTKMGIDKLLGTGKVTEKLNVTVEMASPRAIEKIEAAGGSVTLPDAE